MIKFEQFRIAARGLVICNQKLLFVSNEGKYWYLPGGRLECGESLPQCVEREIYEETGFLVKTKNLCYVQERLDVKDNIHKIHFYFQTEILEKNKEEHWQDKDGSVQFQRFFSLEDIQNMQNIVPRFLSKGQWRELETQEFKNDNNNNNIYQGSVKAKGFEEMV